MANVLVNFLHPIDGSNRKATVDDSLTTVELINLLVDGKFVPGPASEIELMLKGQDTLMLSDQTLTEAGVEEGSTIKVVMATNAGIKPFSNGNKK